MHWTYEWSGADMPEFNRLEMSRVPIEDGDWRRIQMAYIRQRRTFVSIPWGGYKIGGLVQVTALWPKERRATFLGSAKDLFTTFD